MGVAYEKGITLNGVEVEVKHKQNIVVKGPKDTKQRQLKITELRRTILLRGPHSEEDKKTLLWGANHCPVSNSLEGAMAISTRLHVM
ncbi:MAG: OsmC family protein [Actinomycetota bacterium]